MSNEFVIFTSTGIRSGGEPKRIFMINIFYLHLHQRGLPYGKGIMMLIL